MLRKPALKTASLLVLIIETIQNHRTPTRLSQRSIVPSSAHDFSKKRAEVEKMGSDVM
jgi:hypothetical protein